MKSTHRSRSTAIACVAIAAMTLAASYPRPGRTHALGITPDGAGGGGASLDVAVSGDGTVAAFRSNATTLVPDDTNGTYDVFVRDLPTGVTRRVSVASDGTESADDRDHAPVFGERNVAISRDGRWVAFPSHATNLVPADTNAKADVFVHDLMTGTTTRVSVADDGSELADGGEAPAISADGRHVAFRSGPALYLRDRLVGTTEQLDVSSQGTPSNFVSYGAAVSDDGRFVSFQSSANNLDTSDASDNIYAAGAAIYLRDRLEGSTRRVSGPDPVTKGNKPSYASAAGISGDGGAIAFYSDATDLVPADRNTVTDVFVRDVTTGLTSRVSVASDGAEANGPSTDVSISADGRFVSFTSTADNLVPGDTNAAADVFVHDRVLGVTERVSVHDAGTQSGGGLASRRSWLSADGSWVGFESTDAGLAGPSTGGYRSAYSRLRGAVLGTHDVTATSGAQDIVISGAATMGGTTVTSATSTTPPGPVPGTTIAAARLDLRVEQDDLLLRLSVPDLPSVRLSGIAGRFLCRDRACVPSVTTGGPLGYHAQLRVDGARYEVAITPAGATVSRCDAVCVPVGVTGASVGTTGPEVIAAIPLELIGATLGSELTEVRVSAGAGDLMAPLMLPDATVPTPTVQVALAPAGTDVDQLHFDHAALPFEGAFAVTIPVASASTSDMLWVRACVGADCGVARPSWPAPQG